MIILIAIGFTFKVVNSYDYLTEYIYEQEFSGKITNKYLDKNHSYKRLGIDLGTSNEILAADAWIGLYENAEIGDSIIKISGQGELKIYRKLKLIYTSRFNIDSGSKIISRFSDRKIN